MLFIEVISGKTSEVILIIKLISKFKLIMSNDHFNTETMVQVKQPITPMANNQRINITEATT